MKIFHEKRRLLYVPIFGGLGNQMFQMAHALNISYKDTKKSNIIPVLIKSTLFSSKPGIS